MGVIADSLAGNQSDYPLPPQVSAPDDFSGADTQVDSGTWDSAPAASRGAGVLSTPAPLLQLTPQPQTQTQGAIGAGVKTDSAAKLALMQEAMDRINQQQRTNLILRQNNGFNLPLLAMAGGLLSPTRSGTFGESLGNAFSAATPVAQQQRQQDIATENALAQQEWNRLYQTQLMGINQQKANTGDTRAATGQENSALRGMHYANMDSIAIQKEMDRLNGLGQGTFQFEGLDKDGNLVTRNTKSNAISIIPAPQGGLQARPSAGASPPPAGDPTVARTAEMVANYKLAPPTGFALKSPFWQAVLAQLPDDYDAKEFGARNKAFKDFATGTQGNTARFADAGMSHVATMHELVDALNNGDIQAVNRVANAFAAATGNPAPTTFDAAKQIVGQEIVKAVVGSGAGSAEERKTAAEKLLAANSPQQLHDVLNVYTTLLGGQLGALRNQYERTTKLHNFDTEFLSPSTYAALQAVPGAYKFGGSNGNRTVVSPSSSNAVPAPTSSNAPPASSVTTPVAREEGLPLPDTADKLKNGEVYKTSRGLGRWDGSKFIPVAPQ